MTRIIESMVGRESQVICALVECMDSIITATLYHRAIVERLHCVLVDNGLLRYESNELMEEFNLLFYIYIYIYWGFLS